jgi:hypothetical protein
VMKRRARWSTPVSRSSYASPWLLRGSVHLARLPRRALLIGLALTVVMTWGTGGSALADDRLSIPDFGTVTASPKLFKICENPLCAVARWAIKSPALILARNRSSRTAKGRWPTRRRARRSTSAPQPAVHASSHASSLAMSHLFTSAPRRATERDAAITAPRSS